MSQPKQQCLYLQLDQRKFYVSNVRDTQFKSRHATATSGRGSRGDAFPVCSGLCHSSRLWLCSRSREGLQKTHWRRPHLHHLSLQNAYRECLQGKTTVKIVHVKKVKLALTECLQLLGIALGPSLAKIFCEGPDSICFWLCRPESLVTSTGLCYCCTSRHRSYLIELVWPSSNKALCTKTGDRLDLACRL